MTTGNGTSTTFDPAKHLRKLAGRDYLEVKWRLVWLRMEHADAQIATELVEHDRQAKFCMFRATVTIPNGGSATGYGSETATDFADYPEKSETKALGRALAALGYGTQFTVDFDMVNPDGSSHVVDSPVETPAATRTRPAPAQISSGLATPAQIKLIYLTGTRDAHLTEEETEERSQEQYGRLPLHLTKQEASEFIDALKAAGLTRTR